MYNECVSVYNDDEGMGCQPGLPNNSRVMRNNIENTTYIVHTHTTHNDKVSHVLECTVGIAKERGKGRKFDKRQLLYNIKNNKPIQQDFIHSIIIIIIIIITCAMEAYQ